MCMITYQLRKEVSNWAFAASSASILVGDESLLDCSEFWVWFEWARKGNATPQGGLRPRSPLTSPVDIFKSHIASFSVSSSLYSKLANSGNMIDKDTQVTRITSTSDIQALCCVLCWLAPSSLGIPSQEGGS